MNPALQGYLAAMEESLAADGGLADAGAQLHAVADLVEGNNALLLAVNDGSVPVAARRAVLDAPARAARPAPRWRAWSTRR